MIEQLVEISKLGGLLTGLGALILYTAGMGAYVMGRSLFGVEPFEFGLTKCLEFGALSVARLVMTAPMLLVLGVARVVELGGEVLPILALSLTVASGILLRRNRSHAGALMTSLLFLVTSLVMAMGYLASLSVFQARNLLIDPAVNLRIEQVGQSSAASLDRSAISELTSWIIFRNDDQLTRMIGGLVVWHTIALAFTFLAWRLVSRCRGMLPAGHQRMARLLHREARLLVVGVIAYLAFVVAFWLPASLLIVHIAAMPKVDVSIGGLEALTSKEYLIEYAEYGDSFVFYVPTQQNVIQVAKQNVRFIVAKGPVEPFGDRAVFLKAWLGGVERYDFASRIGLREGCTAGTERVSPPANRALLSRERAPTEDKSSLRDRPALRVLKVAEGSRAGQAGVLAGDILLCLNGTPLKDSQSLIAAIEAAPLDRTSEVLLLRKGEVRKIALQVELRP